MSKKNATMEEAIKSEPDASEKQKSDQLALLTDKAKALTKSQMEDLINGKMDNVKHLTIEDMMSLKKQNHYRFQNNLGHSPMTELHTSENGTYDPNYY